MTIPNIIVAVLSILVLGVGLAGSLILAARGKDLAYFETLQSSNPRYYRNLVRVCRFNGPICVVLTVVMLVVAILGAISGKLSPRLLAVGGAVLSAALLWLSVRWSIWAWKKHLTKQ